GFVVQPYHPFTKASKLPVEAGKPMEAYVEIFPTAAQFAPGHTLRLTLQSGDVPHLTPPLPQALDSLGGTIKVWHDAQHPSQLIVELARVEPEDRPLGVSDDADRPRADRDRPGQRRPAELAGAGEATFDVVDAEVGHPVRRRRLVAEFADPAARALAVAHDQV